MVTGGVVVSSLAGSENPTSATRVASFVTVVQCEDETKAWILRYLGVVRMRLCHLAKTGDGRYPSFCALQPGPVQILQGTFP